MSQQVTAREKSLKLEGKIVVITGAGSGVGKAMATLFAQNGAAMVVAVDVVPERVKQLQAELGSKGTAKVHDLASRAEVEKMVDDTLSAFGRVDILCNNAGIMDGAKPVAETEDPLWERILNINLNAPFWASRRVLPAMLRQGSGVILNTASVAGLYGGVAGAAYTVSKHALIGLTKNIAAHYGGKGIRCNAMALGSVQTNIGIGSGAPSQLGMETLQKAMATMPKMADPMEIAKAGLFLVSEDASYVNGACLVVDKGWTVIV